MRIMYCFVHSFYVVRIITFSGSSCCSFLVLELTGELESLEYGLRGTWVLAGTSSSWTGHADLVLTNLSSGHAVRVP